MLCQAPRGSSCRDYAGLPEVISPSDSFLFSIVMSASSAQAITLEHLHNISTEELKRRLAGDPREAVQWIPKLRAFRAINISLTRYLF